MQSISYIKIVFLRANERVVIISLIDFVEEFYEF